MSLIDLFKEFHSRAVVDAYPSSARALYFTLLGEFNAAHFPEERVYSERELSGLTGLPTTTIHRNLKYLADRGHIKTKKTKRGTVIILNGAPAEHQRSTSGAPAEQSIGLIPYTQNQDDKTKDDDDARVRENEMDVHELWEQTFSSVLRGDDAYELERLERKHGRESFNVALTRTKNAKPSNPFAYFKKVLENLNKPQTTSKKGGERNDNATENQRGYKQPDTSKDPANLQEYL